MTKTNSMQNTTVALVKTCFSQLEARPSYIYRGSQWLHPLASKFQLRCEPRVILSGYH